MIKHPILVKLVLTAFAESNTFFNQISIINILSEMIKADICFQNLAFVDKKFSQK